MGRRGKRRSSSRGTRGRSSSVTLSGKDEEDRLSELRSSCVILCGKDEEDRLSKLPDDLINYILSYVDSKVAVQTMVLSKRWVNIWTTLTCLILEPPIPWNHENFVRNFFKYRDQQYLISKIKINGNHGNRGRQMLKICLDYTGPHNVEHLFICHGNLDDYPCLNSARLKTLHLTNCLYLRPMNYWILPSLTSLYLKNVPFGINISGFENLKGLTLVGKFGLVSNEEITRINCPKLQSLTLFPENPCTFIVSAPSLSHLNYRSKHVPKGFSPGDGFPFMKQVHIDIQKKYWDFFQTPDEKEWIDFDLWDRIKLAMQNFNSMLNAVRETVLLELSSEKLMVV